MNDCLIATAKKSALTPLVICLAMLLAFVTVQANAQGQPKIFSGTGSPEGAVAANPGDTFISWDGTIYLKNSGSDKTGWAAVTNSLASATNASALTSGTLPLARISQGEITEDKTALSEKPSVGLLAASNITLSGAQTIDGVSGTAGTTLVLATGQSTASQNGPWIMQTGAWTRPAWFPSGGTTQGIQFSTIFIRLGATYSGSTWRLTTAAPITIDTTSTAWVQTPLALNASSVTGTIPAANLPSLSTTVNSQTCTVGSSCTVADATKVPVSLASTPAHNTTPTADLRSTPSVIVDNSANIGTNTSVSTIYTDLGTFTCPASGSNFLGDALLQIRLAAGTLTPADKRGLIYIGVYSDSSGAPGSLLTTFAAGVAPAGALGSLNASAAYAVTPPPTQGSAGSSPNFPELNTSLPLGIVNTTGGTYSCTSAAILHLVLYVPTLPGGDTLQFNSATAAGQGHTSTDGSTWSAATNIAGYFQIRGTDAAQLNARTTMLPTINVYGVQQSPMQVAAINNNAFAGNCTNASCIHSQSYYSSAWSGNSIYGSYAGVLSNQYGGVHLFQQYNINGALVANPTGFGVGILRNYDYASAYNNSDPLLDVNDASTNTTGTPAPLARFRAGGATYHTATPTLAGGTTTVPYSWNTANTPATSTPAYQFKVAGTDVFDVMGGGIRLNASQTLTGLQGSTGAKLLACTGAFTNTHIVSIDSNGNCVDGGANTGATGVFFLTEDVSHTTAATAAPAQNATKLYSIYINAAQGNLSNTFFFITTADNSTNQYDLGLYGPNCSAGATNVPLVVHTGAQNGSAFATASTSTGHLALVGAPVATGIVPGWYCIAITSSAASPSMVLGGDTGSSHVVMFGAGASPGGSTGTTTAGALNASITAPGTSVLNGNIPWEAWY